ncbi:MAG: AMP-binding protein [Betaproteobacteria bacterium]|nr:AMP-binding protein [Betaproteobacteria bacterium]
MLLPHLLASRTAAVNLWHGRNTLETWDASHLRGRVAQWATGLYDLGVRPGSVVATAAPTSLELIASLIAAWYCGAAVTVLPEPVGAGTAGEHRFLEGLEATEPEFLITSKDFGAVVPESVTVADLARVPSVASAPHQTGPRGPCLPVITGSRSVALLQLTSGSTGRSKVVPVTHEMLLANCQASSRRAAINSADHMVSWLPLTHDMGFSGAFVHALVNDIELTLIPTEQFARFPLCLLQAISHTRATLSPNPPSAYGILARFSGRAIAENLDLSTWRYAWVGAEPVFANILERFETSMRPVGLRSNTLKPSYGMAEAVVAITAPASGPPWQGLSIRADALRMQGLAIPCDRGSPDAIVLVSNGPPLDGIDVKVCDDSGTPLPDGHQGVLWARGASVLTRYLNGEDGSRFVNGWYETGDIGFLWQGEVYVSGRAKDLIARGGIKIGAREIECVVEEVLGLHYGRVAAFSYCDHVISRERVIVLISRNSGGSDAAGSREIAEIITRTCGIQIDEVSFCGPGHFPRTTSGKLRRSEIRQRWECGEFRTRSSAHQYDTLAL